MNLDADFATFDIQANGGHLEFSQGNTIISPQVVGTDAHRAVRSTSPARANATSTVEFIHWSPDGSNPSLALVAGVPPLIYGIGTAAATLNDWVGFDANAFGFCPGDGKVYSNNAAVATYSAAVNGDKVGMTVDMRDVTAPTLTIRKNNIVLGTIAMPANAALYFMATISGNPGGRALSANSGITPQYYGIDDGGWYLPIDRVAPILIASDSYMTASTDTPRHEKYDGNLDSKARPMSMSDGVPFWMDGPSAPAELRQGGGLVQLQLNDPLANGNTSNIYLEQGIATDAAKGVPVYMGRVTFDGAISTMEAQYAGVLDRAEPDSLQTIQIYVRGMESLLADPLRRPQFAPSEPNPQVRLLPMPIAEGVCRNYEGTVLDNTGTTDRRALHDAAITAFGENRAAGVVEVFGGDYSQTADGSGIVYAVQKPDKRTVETTSFGGAFDSVAADYFQASGDFTTATAYAGGGADNGYPTAAGVQWHGNYFLAAGAPFQLVTISGHKYLRAQDRNDGYAWFYQTAYKARAGYTYTVSINVREIPYFGIGDPYDVPPARLILGYNAGPPNGYNFGVNFSLDHTGVYTGFFVNNTGADQNIVFQFCSNNVTTTTEYFGIDSIKINELPPVGETVDLPGPGLTAMVNAFAVKRGPLDAYQVNTDDTDAIDTATGYIYGLRVSESENPSCAQCLQEILDSCTSGRYGSPSFQLRVLRLFKPEDTADIDIAGTLTRSDFLDELIQMPDYAENLTARAQGRRNHSPYSSGDFGQSTLQQVDAITREQLSRDYQWTVTTTVKLANRYRRALGRNPKTTLLDIEAHGQDFIDHACGPFANERNFYGRARVLMPYGRNFQIGQVWLVENPNVTGGSQKLLLRGFSPKQTQADQPTARPIFWGL
jgi:hypothetical protein